MAFGVGWPAPARLRQHSVESMPWRHPFLTEGNLRAFRSYSEAVWAFAADQARGDTRPLSCAFVVNMAQNMYNWAKLVQAQHWEVELFPNIMDTSALNAPEWEEFDGEYGDVMDGSGFLARHAGIPLKVPCSRVGMDGAALLQARQEFDSGTRAPLLHLLAQTPQLRHEALLAYEGIYPYHGLARRLSAHDVSYAAGVPLGPYASGRPYCVFSVGGDLMFDCGRDDDFGAAMTLAFNAARFLLTTNPHTLGHARRLGFTNPVYLPYPIDDATYCPAPGNARAEWEARYGPGVYFLSSARIDASVKGQGREFFDSVLAVCAQHPQARFIFLAWGNDAAALAREVELAGRKDRILLLPPVGKRRLLDYYRSCDVVIDQFVYGYYGATALEAAAAGKPVIMRLREDHYSPLYSGDVAPVENVTSLAELAGRAGRLACDAALRSASGVAMREWVVRTHGRERTVPLLMSLLRLAARGTALPTCIESPLLAPLSAEEIAYHAGCLVSEPAANSPPQ
jgi:glycosyltransferase involved in cell wall biosynthesis